MKIVKKLLCIVISLFSFGISQEVALSITNYSEGQIEVSMTNSVDVGGFQFDIDVGGGLADFNVTGASGGSAADAGFTVSTNSTGLILGFSFTGGLIPAGSSGVLCNVSGTFTGDSGTIFVSTATMSSPAGTSLSTDTGSEYTVSAGSTPGCMDENACNYNLDATEDDGSCTYPDNNFDCDGNCTVEEDCNGDCGGSAIIDECGVCDGGGAYNCWNGELVCDLDDCSDEPSTSHFSVEIAETGESTLFIFETSIEGLESGDEVGIYDTNGVLDVQGNTGEILVGAGTWIGTQLEVVGIGAVDLSEFGGPILPGAAEGNTMSLKVWKSSEDMEYNTTYTTSAGSGSFNGLFTAINSIELVLPDPPHYSVEIAETGESTLFIFEDSIVGLESGDEVGIYDTNGIIDGQGNSGQILVGAGTWTGAQLEVVGIQAVDLSEFGGPILPGAVEGNTMSLKVWKDAEEMEYDVTYGTSSGSGLFNGLFTAIDSISFEEACEDDDSSVSGFGGCAGAVAALGCDFLWAGAPISEWCPETCDACPLYGCTDSNACNYDPDATDDDGSCAEEDCLGECDGGAFVDDCGECVAAGTNADDCLDIAVPFTTTLLQNYPNPFNPTTMIDFSVEKYGYIELNVYDILGNHITNLISGDYNQGDYAIKWDGLNGFGEEASSGIYIYQLRYETGVLSKKMILIR